MLRAAVDRRPTRSALFPAGGHPVTAALPGVSALANYAAEIPAQNRVGATAPFPRRAAPALSLEWLNHALVNADRFVSRPEHAQSWIPGVPNAHLASALAGFGALALMAILPFPSEDHA